MTRTLNKREQKILIACLLSVLAAVLVNGVFIPLRDQEAELDADIALEKRMLGKDLGMIAQADILQGRYEEIMGLYGRSGTFEEAASAILTEVERSAAEFGLLVADLKPGKASNDGKEHYISVDLTIHSDYVEVLRFLHALQQPPLMIDVRSLDIQQTTRRGRSNIIARLTLGKTFLLSDAGPEGQGPATSSRSL